jgi:hypothetical protein
MMNESDFYKEQTFKLMNDKLDALTTGQKNMMLEIIELKEKVNRIYWIAGAIGVGVSVIWGVVKERITGLITKL